MTLAEELVSSGSGSAEKEKTDLFGAIASVGELFFDALMKIVHMFIGAGKYIGAAAARGWQKLKKLLLNVFDKAAGAAIMPFIRYAKAFKMGGAEISKAADEKGFAGGAAASIRVAGRVIFGKRGLAVTLVNWCLPIVSCIFLFNIISFANSQTYALKLTVNGDFIGYISDETVFTSAEKMVQKRINYTGSNTDVITFEPIYEVDIIGYGKTLNTYQVTDKILGLLYDDISEGYGLYIGDAYFGTLDGHDSVDAMLESLLDNYRTDDHPDESVSFEKDISFIKGKYMKDSFVDERDIINLLSSYRKVASYYTVQNGDSAALICDKVDMTFEELAMLNPGFNSSTPVHGGDRIKITQDEPFLNIVITRKEYYNEPIQYDTIYNDDSTIYERDSLVMRNGANGERAVTANVSYINDVEVNRQVLTRTVTKEPVTRIVAVGTKPRSDTAGPPTVIEEGKFVWPVGTADGGAISEMPYGHGGYYGHKGVDIAAPAGTPIVAGAAGTITHVGWYYGYGNLVKIQHDNGLETYYGHCIGFSSTIYVGKRVTANECIAYVGSTGESTGNHLHFEVRRNNIALYPLDYLPEHKFQPSCIRY